MTIDKLVWEFDQGKRPSELVKQGYPKSTVYAAYHKWLRLRTIGLPGLKIFISHSVSDMNLVVRLYDLLTASGCFVYIAELQPQPGSIVTQKVERMIEESDYIIALLTKDGLRSPFVNYEIGFAKKANKPIIPLVEYGIKVPYFEGIDVLYFNKEDPEQTIEWLMGYFNQIRRQKAQAAFMSALATLSIIAIVGIGILGLFGLFASTQRRSR
jgi:hypothetical protein